jgi:hypothetical protein
MKINKGGRPKKPADEKRNVAIKFSCTETENKFIEKHSAAAGYKQTALFLHDFFIKTIEEGKFNYVKQNEINQKWVNELCAIGNNVNQLAQRRKTPQTLRYFISPERRAHRSPMA